MKKISLFDAHCDTPTYLYINGKHFYNSDGHISTDKLNFEKYTQVFAFCSDVRDNGIEGYDGFKRMLSYFENETKITPDFKDKVNPIISIEGAELLECDEGLLEDAYRRGVRIIHTNWNYDNALGTCHLSDLKTGLSQKGKSFVRKASRLGIIVDVSHASERTFWDVLETSELPVIAGHSNSKSVCANSRNLTDEQFKAIVRCGGCVGINLYSLFLTNRGNGTIDDVYRHISHFLELGGENSIGFGCDFDGCDVMPKEIGNISDIYKIFDYLLGRKIDENIVENIFYNNFEKVVEKYAVCKHER